MSIWAALAFMCAGAMISEMYHTRMWVRYQQGKREGQEVKESTKQRLLIQR